MPRIGASSHGESKLRMLRVVRRGDRHDPKDFDVTCRFEGDFTAAFTEGRADGLIPGEALKNLVHAVARTDGRGEIEPFGLAVCDRLLSTFPQVTRVRVEIAEQPWRRLELGGKAQGQAFEIGSAERRTTAVTSNGEKIAVVSGIEQLTVMRTSGFRANSRHEDASGRQDRFQRLLVGTLAARWTYSSPDVTFGPYRQGVRSVIIETFASHASRSVEHTLHAIADVALSSYAEIADITLSMLERPYRPADLFTAGVENPDDLFLVVDEPLGSVEVRVERYKNEKRKTKKRKEREAQRLFAFLFSYLYLSATASSFCACSSVLNAASSVCTTSISRLSSLSSFPDSSL